MAYINAHRLGELIENFDDALSATTGKAACADIATLLRELKNRRERDQRRQPTHRCRDCGALWIEFPPGTAHPDDSGSWSLFSPKCGPCCDNAPMDEQIEPLNISDTLRARIGALESRLELLAPGVDFKFVKLEIGDADAVGTRNETIKGQQTYITRLRTALDAEREAHAALQVRCFKGFPSASDGIFDAYRETFKSLQELKDEDDGLHDLIQTQGKLLTGVVNAIKGEPPMNTSWSHHNAPELVAELVGDLALYKHGYAALQKENAELRNGAPANGDLQFGSLAGFQHE